MSCLSAGAPPDHMCTALGPYASLLVPHTRAAVLIIYQEASAFIKSFSKMLDQRLARIDLAHPEQDVEEWLNASKPLGPVPPWPAPNDLSIRAQTFSQCNRRIITLWWNSRDASTSTGGSSLWLSPRP